MQSLAAPSTKIPNLDAWRGILSLLVCFTHAWDCFIYPFYAPYNWAHMLVGFAGRFAVLGFFIASGLAIANNCASLTAQQGYFPVLAYIQRRFERLAPPMLFSIVLCLLLEWVYNYLDLQTLAHGLRLPRSELRYNLRMVILGFASLGTMGDVTGTVNGPLWTFAIELGCYGLVGMIGAMVSGWHKRQWLHAVVASLLLVYFLYRALFPTQFFHPFAWLVFGLAWGANYRHITIPEGIANLFTPICMVLAVVSLIPGNWKNTLDNVNHLSASMVAQTLFSAGFMAWVLRRQPSSLLAPMEVLGRSSFTLYIIHFPLQFVAASYLLPRIAVPKAWAIPVSLLATGSCALLAHLLSPYVEKRWRLSRPIENGSHGWEMIFLRPIHFSHPLTYAC